MLRILKGWGNILETNSCFGCCFGSCSSCNDRGGGGTIILFLVTHNTTTTCTMMMMMMMAFFGIIITICLMMMMDDHRVFLSRHCGRAGQGRAEQGRGGQRRRWLLRMQLRYERIMEETKYKTRMKINDVARCNVGVGDHR